MDYIIYSFFFLTLWKGFKQGIRKELSILTFILIGFFIFTIFFNKNQQLLSGIIFFSVYSYGLLATKHKKAKNITENILGIPASCIKFLVLLTLLVNITKILNIHNADFEKNLLVKTINPVADKTLVLFFNHISLE